MQHTGTAGPLLKQAVHSPTQVVEGSSKNIEVAIVDAATGLHFLTDAEVDAALAEVEADKAAAAPQRGGGGTGGDGGAP